MAARVGDTTEARRVIAALPSMDRRFLFGFIPFWQARIHALLGESDLAMAALERAFAQGRPHEPAQHFIRDFESLWDDPRFIE
ncbi:MAG: hypothetical protein ACE5F1_16210, partial [Planctomycetota bacterium]